MWKTEGQVIGRLFTLSAAAGKMKDAHGDRLESPIFGYRGLESLESDGATRLPAKFAEQIRGGKSGSL